jgi:uncharacterized protein YfaS (alpha-2-macroglobulin family)
MGREQQRATGQRLFDQGNFKDAYERFHTLTADPQDEPRMVSNDLNMALQCLQRLNHLDQIDALLEETVKIHANNWRLLDTVAQHYANADHCGFIIAGKFQRGSHRGGRGKLMNSVDRDRVRALQLLVQAMPLAMKDENRNEVGVFFRTFASRLLRDNNVGQAWRLQYLTDLKTLPDYEDGWGDGDQPNGAPVDADGKPVFHYLPKSFETAETDGQRWRWCLQQTIDYSPNQSDSVQMQMADFLWNQFGVHTMAQYGWRFGRGETDDTDANESGTYALNTLGENETIARLATGIKRFPLPEEFNFIKLYQEIAKTSPSSYGMEALERLATIFENRRQYPKSAEYWKQLLAKFPSADHYRRQRWQDQLDQIEKNWGRFETVQDQPAGRGATVEFRFRNGKQVQFTAHEIKVEKLLEDVKAYYRSNPKDLNWDQCNINDIGYRLVEKNQRQYLGQQVAEWEVLLQPRENHFDKRITITTPLQRAGAYLLTAKMNGGNTSFIVLWLSDTAIVKKALNGETYYYIADAMTGKQIPKANVEFFGWRQNYHDRPVRHEIVTTQFAEYTDAKGQIIVNPERQTKGMQWLVTARTDDGRFAYLGFTNIWSGRWYDAQYNTTKIYAITDRPVYRPEQKAKYKFWVRHAKYDMADTSDFAGRDFTVQVINPKGEKIAKQTFKADAYGGFDSEYAIPADATLGVYRLNVEDTLNHVIGGGSFRVEEYKKPEYEVTVDAPTAPVMLGDKITATIKAKYYFGSPVTNAKVKYKVQRTPHTDRWYPIGPWDWLYGSGYWWFSYDYDWYPGWHHWGCVRPMPFWHPHPHQPPELVVDREVAIGPDGTVKVEIDTGIAKAIHPDQDQNYTITAEVVDQSRRTIVGTGKVLVARKPFTVYAWLDRGYYRTGDTVKAHFAARTLDGKPVEGQGELRLLKLSYKDGKPVETVVQTWQVNTNAEGTAEQQITASEAGQYRVSYKLAARGQGTGNSETSLPSPASGRGAAADGAKKMANGKPLPSALTLTLSRERARGPDSNPQSPIPNPSVIEGGYVFTVIGQGFDGSQFRFNHLELIPDKREYAPGEKVKLQINTDRTGGVVLLFPRPSNGICLLPKVIELNGKSVVEEFDVVKKDMPNFFFEAVTVADGRVYTEVKEIVVPPEKRVLNVEIQPSKEAYKPGEKAKVKLRLTDFAGKPFVGSTVVSIYDKSVEYISGGSNVPDIKAFFWKWRRNHHPSTETNLERWFQNLVAPKTAAMNNLGVFGGTVDEDAEAEAPGMAMPMSAPRSSMGGMMMKAAAPMRENRLAASDSAMPMAAPMVAKAKGVAFEAAPGGGEAGPMVEPTIRKNFADTALWVGALTTAADGTADVALDMPENLTTWRIKVWGMGQGTRVGEGQTDVVTRKDLIIRMEAPRFFVQTDEVVLSAIVHNYLKTKKKVQVSLEFDGPTLRLFRIEKPMTSMMHAPQSVEIAPNGEARVDWRVKVLDEGQAVIRMKALTDEESDAMEQKFPCYIHGMSKTESFSGAIRPTDESGKFTFDVPKDRRPKESRLEVRFSPTLAGAMVDALPYLVDYPYGCTEQTLNRFVPTVITQKILLDMGLDLKEIEKKQTNLNAQEIGNDAERAKQWGRGKTASPRPQAGEGAMPDTRPYKNPVFDRDEVARMVKDGVQRLTEMQCSDGGWGWFSGWGEHSYPHTTAVVVHGLQIAKENGVALVPGVLERGVEWLKNYQAEQVQLIKNAEIKDKPLGLRWKPSADNMDAFAYMVLADANIKNVEMLDFLYRDRTKLAVYGMAMYGLALEKQGEKEKLTMILQNIGQYVEQDNENQTAWLHLPQDYWWCWYGSEYEAHAYYLKLLAHTDPKGELAPRIVKYLLNNRKHATYWNSTRDTALCLEAMADFIRRSGEDKPQMTVEVYFDGQLKKTVEITPQKLFQFDNKFVLEGDAIESGRHTVELKRKGQGPLYFNGYQTNFTLEDFIKRAGLEVKVNRKYYKLVKADKSVHVSGSRGQAATQKVEKYDRQELPNLATVKSGDLVEIELEIDSKNDYEYLIFEDMKPAGFEPVDVRSGYNGNDLGAYVEFRDNRVVFFTSTLARGKHSVSYRMRAEIPGRFSALPTRAAAMYAPELKGNSDEMKIGVED